jgi:hypothetical protein
MDRKRLVEEVSRKLGRRKLVWAGLRGDDIEPLSDLPQLEASFSIMSRYRRRSSVESMAYEDLSGVRVDPEMWDIDEHIEARETREFRRGLLRALAGDSALLPYRPSQFLSAIWFARGEHCLNLGMFGGHQAAFEHKPWVETSISKLPGVYRIPWRYVADEEQLSARSMARGQDVMLRRSRTSGGEGFVRVPRAKDIVDYWPQIPERFASVAPFIEGALPVNVGATVWADGGVTVHYPSVQLIGIPGIVTREFGYCGNDFGRARDIEPVVLDELEYSTRQIGGWLARNGYRGSFGVDFLVHEAHALFTEINPRFQGSTHMSCRLSIDAGESCLMLEHVAAWLGLPAPQGRPLRDMVAELPDRAHIVLHWTGDLGVRLQARNAVRTLREYPGSSAIDLLPGEDIDVNPGAPILRWAVRTQVTESGYELLDEVGGSVKEAVSSLRADGQEVRMPG